MKKRMGLVVAFVWIVALLGFVSCGNITLQKNDEVFGSLEIAKNELEKDSDTRALHISSIKYARATVTGTGITDAITSDYVQVTDGTGTINVSDIPTGNNRIVTVQGYDENKQAITGAYISNIVNISSGTNKCSVTQATTALGNVFSKLNSLGVALGDVLSSTISTYIDSDYSWALIDTDQIATDYKNNALSGKDKSNYIAATGKVILVSSLTNAYTLQITDPSSDTFTMSSSISTKTVLDAAPGTWCILALDASGNVVARDNNVRVISGQNTEITVTETEVGDVTGKIVVHVPSSYGYEYAYAWGGDDTSAEWPGDKMTKNGSNYDYELDCTSSKIIFNSGSDSNKTNDMYITEGEWTYNGSNTTTDSGVSLNFDAVTSSGDGSTTVTFGVTNPHSDEDCIKVHAEYQYIYVWNTGTSIDKTANAMTADGDGYYSYTINASSASIIFEDDANWTNKTSDLSRTEYGEWWYHDGAWYEYNPSDSEAPELVSFTADKSGIVSGDVTFTIEATDNLALSKAVLTVGSETLANVSLSSTTVTATYVWQTAYVANGSYTVTCTVYDVGSNVSSSKTLSFTTNNANLPPVAVITGAGRAQINAEKTYTAKSSYDQNGGTIASYTWTVTGATLTSGQGTETIAVTMPSSESTVTISLKVTDNEGASSALVSKEVTVSETDSTDFRDETIYFLMTTRFYDGDSSNNRYCWDDEACFKSETLGDPGWRGDFKGLIEKLDYIKALGFTAIWITPVVENASGLDYHGYHAFDFSKVDPRYESTDTTYQDLIDACHEKGIKVIQDIVLNHTGNFGERNLLNIMEKDYSSDDGVHSVPAYANPDGKDIYGNSAYEKLTAGAKTQGYNSYEEIPSTDGDGQYQARLATMKNDKIDLDSEGRLYHHYGVFQWESYYVQEGQMAGDCVDLNTENPKVAEYLRNCYINYINMGVDAFRIDTMKHISRLTMNKEFIPQFKAAGGDSFFMFGEGCVLRNEVFNAGMPGISVCFYTWNANNNKSDASYSWGINATDAATNLAMAKTHFDDNTEGVQPTSDNAFLSGITYHAPDSSKASGLAMIDFYMHHGFENSGAALSIGKTEDAYFNDSTYNVTYVDSHDYGPNSGGYLYTRYSGGEEGWADNFNLMFTFRGIPCVYYGSEIEFQKGMQIEPYTNGNKVPYAQSGRAYYGDHLEGTVTASDFGEYEATGTVATTLSSNLSKHLRKLNKMRAAVPALRRGQYTTDSSYVSGGTAYVRRYTDSEVDSIACISVSGGATFKNLPAGTYIDVCTGDTKNVSEGGSLTASCSGTGNLRIYVNATKDPSITGKIGDDSPFIK